METLFAASTQVERRVSRSLYMEGSKGKDDDDDDDDDDEYDEDISRAVKLTVVLLVLSNELPVSK